MLPHLNPGAATNSAGVAYFFLFSYLLDVRFFKMVGAGEGPSEGASSTSDVLSSSSLPRSFSYGTDDDGLEAGNRTNSRESLLGSSSRMNSRDSLLGSRQNSASSMFTQRFLLCYGNCIRNVNDLGCRSLYLLLMKDLV